MTFEIPSDMVCIDPNCNCCNQCTCGGTQVDVTVEVKKGER